MSESHSLVLATRASLAVFDRLRKELDGKTVTYHERAAIVSIGNPPKTDRGSVLVVTAGTSDIPIAEEAAVTAELMGCAVTRLFDVGVAGVHRVLDQRDLLSKAKVIVVVASFDGMAALLGMMNACSPGVAVVNIDNGFGAGYLASMMNR
jgi:NCAIR mutase (PurE)-related protein